MIPKYPYLRKQCIEFIYENIFTQKKGGKKNWQKIVRIAGARIQVAGIRTGDCTSRPWRLDSRVFRAVAQENNASIQSKPVGCARCIQVVPVVYQFGNGMLRRLYQISQVANTEAFMRLAPCLSRGMLTAQIYRCTNA